VSRPNQDAHPPGIYLGTEPRDASRHFFVPESWRVTSQYVPG
jgi:hypothetical protein